MMIPSISKPGLKPFMILALLFSAILTCGAQVNTLYFMENVPARTVLNPAFVPFQKFYIDLPVISGVEASVGNNSVAANDVITKDGEDILAPLKANNDHSPLLGKLASCANIAIESRVNLLGFGIRIPQGYVTFGIAERFQMGVKIPKSAVDMAYNGAPDALVTKSYNLKSLSASATAFTEIAMGYSRKTTDVWTFGGKIKFLLGQDHADASFTDLNVNITDREINIYGKGSGRGTTSVPFSMHNDSTHYIDRNDITLKNLLHPTGFGLGADIGATCQVDENLQFSASLVDLGFIHWSKSDWNATFKESTLLNSWDFTLNNTDSRNADEVSDALGKTYTSTFDESRSYTSALTATARLGIDYSVVKKKLDVGLLYVRTLGGKMDINELLASVNFHPARWFGASVSYGIINGNSGSIGLGISVATGPVSFFAATDYMPFSYTNNNIPYNNKYVNCQAGISLTFNEKPKKTPCHCDF